MEPHFFDKFLKDPDFSSGKDLRKSEFKLRVGVVTDIYPPNHSRNVSKKFTEYSVDVFVMENAGTVKTYPAVMSDMFASVSDIFTFTPRLTKKDPSSYYLTKGSTVVVLCVNADTQRALIIGGYPNQNLPVASQEPDAGHHLFFEFNGLVVRINKDGEFLVQRKGATDENDDVISGYEDGAGAQVAFLKDGTVTIKAGTSKNISIQMNPDGTINLNSEGNVNINTGSKGGVVINNGSQSMVLGDKLIAALQKFMAAVGSAVTGIPTGGPAAGSAINAAALDFTKDVPNILSTTNKVD